MAQTLPPPQEITPCGVLEDLVEEDGVLDAKARRLGELLPYIALDVPVLVAAPSSVLIAPVRGHQVFRTRTLQVDRVSHAANQVLKQVGPSLIVLVVDAARPLSEDQRRSVRWALPDSVIVVAGLAP